MSVIRIPVTPYRRETIQGNGSRPHPVPAGSDPEEARELALAQEAISPHSAAGPAINEAALQDRGAALGSHAATGHRQAQGLRQAALEPEPEPPASPVEAEREAEMAAFRRRTEARLAQQAEDEKRRLLRAFLQVADNLERALGYGAHLEGETRDDWAGARALRQGVELTYRHLQQLLAQEAVEPIDAVGQPFDPHIHEAMLTTPAEASPGTVIGELERGYRYRGEVLRPARVQVAR